MYNFTDKWFARIRSDVNENLNDWPIRTRYRPFISEADLEFMCGSHSVPESYASPKEREKTRKKRKLREQRYTKKRIETSETKAADFAARRLWLTGEE